MSLQQQMQTNVDSLKLSYYPQFSNEDEYSQGFPNRFPGTQNYQNSENTQSNKVYYSHEEEDLDLDFETPLKQNKFFDPQSDDLSNMNSSIASTQNEGIIDKFFVPQKGSTTTTEESSTDANCFLLQNYGQGYPRSEDKFANQQDNISIPQTNNDTCDRLDMLEQEPSFSKQTSRNCQCSKMLSFIEMEFSSNVQMRKLSKKQKTYETIGRPHQGQAQDRHTKEQWIKEKRAIFRDLKKQIKKQYETFLKILKNHYEDLPLSMMDEIRQDLVGFLNAKALYKAQSKYLEAPLIPSNAQPTIQELICYRYKREVKERFFRRPSLSYLFIKLIHKLQLNQEVEELPHNRKVAIELLRMAFQCLAKNKICFCQIKELRQTIIVKEYLTNSKKIKKQL